MSAHDCALLGLLAHHGWSPARAQLPGLGTDALLRLLPSDYAFGAAVDHAPVGPIAMGLSLGTGIVVWLGALLLLAAHVRTRVGGGPAADRARDLLTRHGGPSLAWMGLWEGNDHWFSADGQAYVPYRVLSGVALTTGDPVGPAGERDRHVDEFLDFAAGHGYTVAFYSATGELVERTEARGWEAIQIAEEMGGSAEPAGDGLHPRRAGRARRPRGATVRPA